MKDGKAYNGSVEVEFKIGIAVNKTNFPDEIFRNQGHGDAFVQKLADFFSENYPELKGFNRRGLYRMKQFYELYNGEEKVSPLVIQLSWSNHLKIMYACKTMDERIFYMNMCIKEHLSKSELERQIDSSYYEIYMLSQNPQSLALETAKKQRAIFFLIITFWIFSTYLHQYLNVIYRSRLSAI